MLHNIFFLLTIPIHRIFQYINDYVWTPQLISLNYFYDNYDFMMIFKNEFKTYHAIDMKHEIYTWSSHETL